MHHQTLIGLISVLVCAMGVTVTAWSQNTYYVDDDAANDSGAGTNWITAKKTIQAAINLTLAGDRVLVSNGTYATGGVVVNPVAAVTTLTNRVAITNAITVQANSTNPADTLIVGAAHNGTNGPSAIRCVYMTNGATLSGFTLTNGHTETTGSITNTYGGGVFCLSTDAVVTNCVITGCSAYDRGGGAAWGTLWNCILIGNTCADIVSDPYSYGGGAYASALNGCLLRGNYATRGGGASHSTLRNGTIETNTGVNRTGGIYNGSAANCIIRGNSGPYGGGAGFLSLTNCLVVNNYGKYAGGVEASTLYQCTIVDNSYGAATYPGGVRNGVLVNCIIVSNYSGGVLSNYDNSCSLTNCCSYPAPATGTNNITSTPGFFDYAADDFHLAQGSACIDAGLNLGFAGIINDLDGLRRPMWRAYDIGCYEAMPPKVTIFSVR